LDVVTVAWILEPSARALPQRHLKPETGPPLMVARDEELIQSRISQSSHDERATL
jgi:hypothetical protein